MKMRIMNFVLLFGYTLMSMTGSAQSDVIDYELKKGEILDILLLQQNPDTDDDLKAYFGTAFPVAKRMSYNPLPGFRIKEITQGNHMPASLILGKWDNVELRETFLVDIIDEVPDFHERRRTIWSYFGLTYYELKEDLSFQLDKNKYTVVTAYWQKSGESIEQFSREFMALAKEKNGEIALTLKNGTSPFGYYYQPDVFIITSWDNEADFKAFYQENIKLSHDAIQHVNQFILF